MTMSNGQEAGITWLRRMSDNLIVETTCPLCYEADELVSLQACHHKSCRSCLARWIEKEESSGQTTAASCPFCRVSLSDEDVHSILGRHFKPKEDYMQSSEEIDMLTLQWINSQTKPCPGCGCRVEKSEGCDHMTCLCGYEFCFGCAQAMCSCERRRTGNFANEGYTVIRNRDGVVMIDACIRRGIIRHEREYRLLQLQHEEEYRWTYYDSPLCPSSGEWIFSRRRNSDSYTALYWELNSEKFKALAHSRASRRERLHEEQQERWDLSRVSGCTSNGRWLFVCRKNSRSAQMLKEQLEYEDIRACRKTTQKNYARESEAAFKVWQMLEKRESVRRRRNAHREVLMKEYVSRT